MSIIGSCLCGAVTFEGRGAVKIADACHCSMCRRWHGSPHVGVHFEDGLHLITADSLRWYESSDWAERGFCSTCGSTLFYRLKQSPDKLSTGAGFFNLPTGLSISEHIFIDEKPDYYDFSGDAPRLTGAEVMARFEAQQKGEAQ